MFKKKNKKAEKIKDILISKFKYDPGDNYITLKQTFIKIAEGKNEQDIKDHLDAIKLLIKEKIVALPKFLALLLLKDMMQTENKLVINYFTKKLMERLAKIVNPKISLSEKQLRESCLEKFSPRNLPKIDEKQHKLDSTKFYILLKECWMHWYNNFQKNYPKIKTTFEKMQKIFEKTESESYYNYPETYNEESIFQEEQGEQNQQNQQNQYQDTLDNFQEYEDSNQNKQFKDQQKNNQKTIPFNQNKSEQLSKDSKTFTKKEIPKLELEKKIKSLDEAISTFAQIAEQIDKNDKEMLLDMGYNIQQIQNQTPTFKEVIQNVSVLNNEKNEDKALWIDNFLNQLTKNIKNFETKQINQENLNEKFKQICAEYLQKNEKIKNNSYKDSDRGFSAQKMKDSFKEVKQALEESNDSGFGTQKLSQRSEIQIEEFPLKKSEDKVQKSIDVTNSITEKINENTPKIQQNQQNDKKKDFTNYLQNQPVNSKENLGDDFEQKNEQQDFFQSKEFTGKEEKIENEEPQNQKFIEFNNFQNVEDVQEQEWIQQNLTKEKNQTRVKQLKELETIQEKEDESESQINSMQIRKESENVFNEFDKKLPKMPELQKKKLSVSTKRNKPTEQKKRAMTLQENVNYEFDLDDKSNPQFQFEFGKKNQQKNSQNTINKESSEQISKEFEFNFDNSKNQSTNRIDYNQIISKQENPEISSQELKHGQYEIEDLMQKDFINGAKFTFKNPLRNTEQQEIIPQDQTAKISNTEIDSVNSLEKNKYIQKNEEHLEEINETISENNSNLISARKSTYEEYLEKQKKQQNKPNRNGSKINIDKDAFNSNLFEKPNWNNFDNIDIMDKYNNKIDMSNLSAKNDKGNPSPLKIQQNKIIQSKTTSPSKQTILGNSSSEKQQQTQSNNTLQNEAKNFEFQQQLIQQNKKTMNYLQEEVITLSKQLKEMQDNKNLEKDQELDKEDIVNLNILKRKNEVLQKQSQYMKNLKDQVEKQKDQEKKKLQEQTKVLTQLVQQYSLYTQKLKSSLQSEKNQNLQKSVYLSDLQTKLKDYDQKLLEFRQSYKKLKESNILLSKTPTEEKLKNKIIKTSNRDIVTQSQQLPQASQNVKIAQHLIQSTVKLLEAQKNQPQQPEYLQASQIQVQNTPSKKIASLKKQPLKKSLKKNSLNLYQEFYKHLSQTQNNQSEIFTPTIQPKQKILVNSQIQQPQNNFEVELKDDSEKINESIKDLIVDKEMYKIFQEEEDMDNINILEPLQKKTDSFYNENYSQENEDYINLKKYTLYQSPKFNLYLKASSLFENSILLQNDYLTVTCGTQKQFFNDEVIVTIELKYQPKFESGYLTTAISTNGPFISEPQKIQQEKFNRDIVQYITFRNDKIKLVEFPQLELKVTFDPENFLVFLVPIPFSINKFSKILPINQETIDQYYQQDCQYLNCQLILNKEILGDFSQMTEIFPDIYVSRENLFLMHICLGEEIEALLEFQQENMDVIKIIMHSHIESEFLLNYIRWFFWIFSIK